MTWVAMSMGAYGAGLMKRLACAWRVPEPHCVKGADCAAGKLKRREPYVLITSRYITCLYLNRRLFN